VFPHTASLAFDAGTFSSGTNILARESSTHDVNSSPPRVAVEGADVIPDWEPWQDSVALALQ
jgi:hypothetical protein